MEVEEAEGQVRQLVDEWGNSIATGTKAMRHASALAKIIAGYVEMFPELRKIAESGYFDHDGTLYEILPGSFGEEVVPRGAEAVQRVLQDKPNYWWYISEVVDQMREREWLPDSTNPANAVRTACERLVNNPETDVHKGRGSSGKIVYSYRPDDEPFDGDVRYIRDEPSSPTSYSNDEEPF